MTTNYESKKDGTIFTLVGEANAEGKVTLESNGSTITVTESTLKRWYKPVNGTFEKITPAAVAVMERPIKVVEGIKLDPQEFKGEVSKKPEAPKVLTTDEIKPKTSTAKKATKKAERAEKAEICNKANEALVTSLLQYGQKKGCEIIAHKVDTVLRFNGKNIMMAFIRKTTATMCFNYLSIPADVFGEIEEKVTVTPDDWKKTLDVWVKVNEDNQKILLDLIDCGVEYLQNKEIEKNAREEYKKAQKATKKEAVAKKPATKKLVK